MSIRAVIDIACRSLAPESMTVVKCNTGSTRRHVNNLQITQISRQFAPTDDLEHIDDSPVVHVDRRAMKWTAVPLCHLNFFSTFEPSKWTE